MNPSNKFGIKIKFFLTDFNNGTRMLAGQPKDRDSTPSRGKMFYFIFFLPKIFRPAWTPLKPPIQSVPETFPLVLKLGA